VKRGCIVGALLCAACGSSRASPGGDDAGASEDAGLDAPVILFDANPTPPPSVGGVTPSHVFLARHREIVVNGYSTSWTAATQVDLGASTSPTSRPRPRTSSPSTSASRRPRRPARAT